MMSLKARRERYDRFITMWKAGVKVAVICKELGVEADQVRRYRRKFGLEPRAPSYSTKPIIMPVLAEHHWREAALMWKGGMDTTQIARRFGKTEAYVYNCLTFIRAMARGERDGKSVVTGTRNATQEVPR